MTSRYVYDSQDEMVAWAEERIPHCRFREDAKAIGQEKDGELTAVVVYDTFSRGSCFVSVAASRRKWFTPEFATVTMAYPFIQCGFNRINCVISERNRLSLRLTRHFGWTEEGRLRAAGPEGEDMLLFGMLRSECRFLPATIGHAGKTPAGAL